MAAVIALCAFPAPSHAQQDSAGSARADSTPIHSTPSHYWRNVAAGFAASILAHEGGHVVAAYAVGGSPSFAFDHSKPTVYSGIDASRDPRRQFIFSSAGLDVQAFLDEAVLDAPHSQGSAFERGILTGGIATAYFYATIGRNADNSDISYMARTSSLTKTQASLIYVAIATLHIARISRDNRYADFFARPSATGGLNVGVSLLQAQ